MITLYYRHFLELKIRDMLLPKQRNYITVEKYCTACWTVQYPPPPSDYLVDRLLGKPITCNADVANSRFPCCRLKVFLLQLGSCIYMLQAQTGSAQLYSTIALLNWSLCSLSHSTCPYASAQFLTTSKNPSSSPCPSLLLLPQ